MAAAAALETMDHRRKGASLSLFYRFKLAQLVLLRYSRGRSIIYSNKLHDYSVNIP